MTINQNLGMLSLMAMINQANARSHCRMITAAERKSNDQILKDMTRKDKCSASQSEIKTMIPLKIMNRLSYFLSHLAA